MYFFDFRKSHLPQSAGLDAVFTWTCAEVGSYLDQFLLTAVKNNLVLWETEEHVKRKAALYIAVHPYVSRHFILEALLADSSLDFMQTL